MKPLTFFLLLLSFSNTYGQDTSKARAHTDDKKILIGFNFSSDLCFRTLKNTDGSPISEDITASRKSTETYKAGFTSGLNICYYLKKNLSIETGLQYSIKGYQTKMRDLTYSTPDPSNPIQTKFIYNYHYLDIPLKVNFLLGKKKLRLISSIGLTTNIFLKQPVTAIIVYSDHTERPSQNSNLNYNKINISPTISAGIDYKINRLMNVRIEPIFRYGVLKTIEAPIREHLYNAGLNIAYYYGL